MPQPARPSRPHYDAGEDRTESATIPIGRRKRVTTSGFEELEDRTPAGYKRARTAVPYIVLGSAIAILLRGAPRWVIAFAIVALMLQLVPERHTRSFQQS
jgi:hypothetical protein